MLAIWHIAVLFSLIFFICACILWQTLIGGAIITAGFPENKHISASGFPKAQKGWFYSPVPRRITYKNDDLR